MPARKPIIIATRGSALALVQAAMIQSLCRKNFPDRQFELKVIKTTGDKLQTASLANTGGNLPKGLFTKELEVALTCGEADLAVHSLKDLPTDLPAGLVLAATPQRADVRDVLIYRANEFQPSVSESLAGCPGCQHRKCAKPHGVLNGFPANTLIATSSTRRKMQLLAARPDWHIVELRGNVTTRLRKVADPRGPHATVLALAGLTRLNFKIEPGGKLAGPDVPEGLLAAILDLDVMLPCVGQGAIGVEIRAGDECASQICGMLNHFHTFQEVTAERAFLRGMGGGCLSPVAAYAKVTGNDLCMRAVSFRGEKAERGEAELPISKAALLGEQLAERLK